MSAYMLAASFMQRTGNGQEPITLLELPQAE